jgi:hypothetical protein
LARSRAEERLSWVAATAAFFPRRTGRGCKRRPWLVVLFLVDLLLGLRVLVVLMVLRLASIVLLGMVSRRRRATTIMRRRSRVVVGEKLCVCVCAVGLVWFV